MRRAQRPRTASFHCKGRPDEEMLIPSPTLPWQNMQEDFDVGVQYVASLKACAKEKDLCRGSALHHEISETGLLCRNIFLGSAVVNMYIKCGELKRAQHVFNGLSVRNVVTWNALIAGYTQHGHGEEALRCFEQMQEGGFNPNAATFACVLKACGSLRALEKGQEIHAQIADACLLDKDTVVASALIDMYNKCGALDRTQQVFDELPFRSTVLWTALISGYTQCGYYEEALHCFKQMQLGGFSLNIATFTSVLKACGSLGYLDKGREIHVQLEREQWLEKNIVAANALIDMYAKCGALEKAQEVFVKLSAPNLVSWTELIAGYAQYGYGNEALFCSACLELSGFSPDSVTYACVLKACGSTKALEKGKRVHAQVLKDQTLERDAIIATELIDMYANCGALENAQRVFDELTSMDVVTWNVLMKGYTQNGRYKETFACFKQMQHKGFRPNETTFTCILESCGMIGALGKAQEVHAQIVRRSLLENDLLVGNAVVNVYVRCAALQKAQEVFHELPVRDTISWNVLIAGYAEHGHGKEALDCYEKMKLGGFPPNSVTTTCLLKACGSIAALDKGEKIHAQVAKEGLLRDDDDVIANALVDMYAKCGAHKRAQQLLLDLPFRDASPWNALISGCTRHGQDEEAFTYFEQMRLQGHAPDEVTFACILKACGSKGSVSKGQELHDKAIQHGLSEYGRIVGTALVVMYAKCGMLTESQYLFDRLPVRDVVSWTALMVGYATMGKDDVVLNIFNDMLVEGIHPNQVTFTTVLQTCRRRGLVHKAELYFEIMRNGYDLDPELEHCICMVDLFSSVGYLDKAMALVKELPYSALCHTLLDACRKQGSANLGRWTFEQMVCLDEAIAPSVPP